MDFVTSVKTCLQKKYFDRTGRASRSEFWWFVLFYVIIGIVINIIASMTHWIVSLAIIPVLIPTVAAGWRRFQDIGMPGHYILVMLVGFVLSLIGQLLGSPTLIMIAGLVSLIVLIFLIVMLIKPSQPEANAYGPLPAA